MTVLSIKQISTPVFLEVIVILLLGLPILLLHELGHKQSCAKELLNIRDVIVLSYVDSTHSPGYE